MILLSKELYSKEALLKAAYSMTGEMYIHLDVDENNYKVELKSKRGDMDEDTIAEMFENELIAQENRRIVIDKTKDLRTMIVARALSSTIVNDEVENNGSSEFDKDEILKDWFESENV